MKPKQKKVMKLEIQDDIFIFIYIRQSIFKMIFW